MPTVFPTPPSAVREEQVLSEEPCGIELDEMSNGHDVAARQPLINHDLDRLHHDDQDGARETAGGQQDYGAAQGGAVDDDAATPSRFVWQLVLAAGLSGLLFGYDVCNPSFLFDHKPKLYIDNLRRPA